MNQIKSFHRHSEKRQSKRGNENDRLCKSNPAIFLASSVEEHRKLTIEEIHELQIRVLLRIIRVRVCAGVFLRLVIVHRVKRRQAQISKVIEIEEFGVGEERKFGIEVERVLLLLLLLHGLIIGRGDRVQILEVLGEVGGATAVEFGHGG